MAIRNLLKYQRTSTGWPNGWKKYHASTLSEMMAAKKYMETIINSINEPIIGLNNEMEILFINDEALNVLNLKMKKK